MRYLPVYQGFILHHCTTPLGKKKDLLKMHNKSSYNKSKYPLGTQILLSTTTFFSSSESIHSDIHRRMNRVPFNINYSIENSSSLRLNITRTHINELFHNMRCITTMPAKSILMWSSVHAVTQLNWCSNPCIKQSCQYTPRSSHHLHYPLMCSHTCHWESSSHEQLTPM